MSRWIDADELIRYGKYGTLVYWEDIEDAPSIDIVRCKECKHCSLDVCVERTVSGKERCINICNRHRPEWVVDEDWFCADGERIE